jgi:phosphodiesterase/alkaline phosphatase D-like protein
MMRRLKVFAAILVALAFAAFAAGVALAASSPTVTTGAATNRTDTSVVLNGTVNPNGNTTGYVFDYGLTTGYGLASTAHSAGHGAKPVAVKSTISGLLPGTTYHYRITALNRSGTGTGADRTFTTTGHPPAAAQTGPPSQVGKTTATPTGTINPEGEATTWVVQYGLTGAYGFETFAQTLPAVTTPVTVSIQLQGLAPGTLFHYQVVAIHGGSVVSRGGDQTFLTEPNPRPHPRVRTRTTPSRASHKPFAFTTSGTVRGPSFIPPALACSGSASIRYFDGRRRVASTVAAIGPDCKFSAGVSFRRLINHQSTALTVAIHYSGNGYLAPADRVNHMTLG